MPTTAPELRAKFLNPPDDGIARCEQIIRTAGGHVHRGWINMDQVDDSEGSSDEPWQAAQYLIEEWDYGYGVLDPVTGLPGPPCALDPAL